MVRLMISRRWMSLRALVALVTFGLMAASVQPSLTAKAQPAETWQECRSVGEQQTYRTQVECDDGLGYIFLDVSDGLRALTYDPSATAAGSTRQPWVLQHPTNSMYTWLWLDVQHGVICGLAIGARTIEMSCSNIIAGQPTPTPMSTNPYGLSDEYFGRPTRTPTAAIPDDGQPPNGSAGSDIGN